MVSAVLFDLDNTILDFNKAERNAFKRTMQEYEIEPTETLIKRYSQLNMAQWKLLELGKLTREEVKLRRYELLFREFHIEISPIKAAKTYENLLAVGHYFMEGAAELLERLKEKYDLYLVTNGTRHVQAGRIESADIAKYFKGIYISEEIGFNKPSKEYFEICFSKMKEFKKAQTVIVGDSLTSDILGGKRAGIRTIWYNFDHAINDTDIKPDYQIQNLDELDAVLELL